MVLLALTLPRIKLRKPLLGSTADVQRVEMICEGSCMPKNIRISHLAREAFGTQVDQLISSVSNIADRHAVSRFHLGNVPRALPVTLTPAVAARTMRTE